MHIRDMPPSPVTPTRDIMHIEISHEPHEGDEPDIVTTFCGMVLQITADDATCVPPGHDAIHSQDLRRITCPDCRHRLTETLPW